MAATQIPALALAALGRLPQATRPLKLLWVVGGFRQHLSLTLSSAAQEDRRGSGPRSQGGLEATGRRPGSEELTTAERRIVDLHAVACAVRPLLPARPRLAPPRPSSPGPAPPHPTRPGPGPGIRAPARPRRTERSLEARAVLPLASGKHARLPLRPVRLKTGQFPIMGKELTYIGIKCGSLLISVRAKLWSQFGTHHDCVCVCVCVRVLGAGVVCIDGGGREELRSHRKSRLCVYLYYQLNTLPSNDTNNAKIFKKINFCYYPFVFSLHRNTAQL